MKYAILTRDGKVHRLTIKEGYGSLHESCYDATDKFFKRKNNRYHAVDIAAVVGYNEPTKKDPRQQELFE